MHTATSIERVPAEDVDDFNGLFHKHPGYALWMLLFLLSLAGIPPTAGFIGKYYIFLALIQTEALRAGGDRRPVRGRFALLLLPHCAEHVHGG